MTSDFPYYLALFGLLFFITVICCCIKLIDIIDRPVSRPTNSMPSWNYANYLQNSPVAVLSPQPDPYLRCLAMAENQGLTMEEYLTATADRPGLYPSTSRDVISSQAHFGNSINHNLPPPPPPAPAPSPNPATPTMYRSNVVPEMPPPISTISSNSVTNIPPAPSRTPRTRSLRERPPKYEDICFDV